MDALRTYFVYETTAGHEKPSIYYLNFLLWPQSSLGLYWSELSIALLGALSLGLAFWKRSQFGTIAFLATATAAHILIYSLIAYKTPWLMLLPWAHACLLAGTVLSNWKQTTVLIRVASLVLIVLGLGYQVKQSQLASGRLANDQRNPYAYVPTSKDAPKISQWLQELESLDNIETIEPIAVSGREYWPLPWYLRQFQTVGYWPQATVDFSDYPVVFAMPEQLQACEQLLSSSHTQLPRGLRNNVPVYLFLRNDLWQHWIHHE